MRLMANEATSHNDEIISICIRFVDKNKNIREEFLEFIPLERIISEQLAKEFVTFYEYFNLDMQDIRGQCYDGAANMSSRKKVLSGRVLDKNDKAVNTHCNSHVLNLSIAATIRMDIIQTVLDKMTAVNIFFNFSPKREGLLEHTDSKKKKILIGLRKIRWSERDKAFEYFHDAFLYIIEAFEIITDVHSDVSKYDCIVIHEWFVRFFLYYFNDIPEIIVIPVACNNCQTSMKNQRYHPGLPGYK